MIYQGYCGHFKHGDKSASLTRSTKTSARPDGQDKRFRANRRVYIRIDKQVYDATA